MEIIWILIGFFALCTMAFIVIAIFLPEWVGITGKKALEIQKHQQADEPKIEKSEGSDQTADKPNA